MKTKIRNVLILTITLFVLTKNIEAQELKVYLGSGFFSKDSVRVSLLTKNENLDIYSGIPESNPVLGYATFFMINVRGFCQISLYVKGNLTLVFTTNLETTRKKRFVIIDELSKGCYSIKFSKKQPKFM